MSLDYLSVVQIFGLTEILFFIVFAILLSPPIRRKLKEIDLSAGNCIQKKIATFYEKHLHFLVIARQMLLFFAPTASSIVLLGYDKTSEFFASLVLLGLSLIVFASIQLPLLMKAHLLVTFEVDDKVYDSTVAFFAGKETYMAARVYNLGYSTYKNSTLIFYFGKDFEIIPLNDPKYADLDFKKKFDVQKRHGGAVFTSKDNFLTIPPQEVFIFPMRIRVPKEETEDHLIEILFHSESTWGMNRIWKKLTLK